MTTLTQASDAEVERWAEVGNGYTLEGEDIVSVMNGAKQDRYRITPAQAARLKQASEEHNAGGDDTPS